MTAVVVMGVSGSGKTTIAEEIARREGWELLEGDDFHPPANIAKMKSGVPLTDDDRWPWLRAIAAAIDERRKRGESVVVACSALKRAYRDILANGHADVVVVYLQGSSALIADRIAARKHHFMPAKLLESQFADLEEPTQDEHAIIVSVAPPPAEIVDAIMNRLRERQS
jgi:gluconokinase